MIVVVKAVMREEDLGLGLEGDEIEEEVEEEVELGDLIGVEVRFFIVVTEFVAFDVFMAVNLLADVSAFELLLPPLLLLPLSLLLSFSLFTPPPPAPPAPALPKKAFTDFWLLYIGIAQSPPWYSPFDIRSVTG